MHQLNRTIELSLRRECALSVVQYRCLSCLKQEVSIEEAQLIRLLSTSASQFSQAVGSLKTKKLVDAKTHGGPAKRLNLTKAGERSLRAADLVLVEACNAVFRPLGAELSREIRTGSMLTNQRHGIIRVDNGAFFKEHACFEAFLAAEHISTKAARDYGLTLTEFRILFELLCNGPLPKTILSKETMLAPSVVSDACGHLLSRSLIAPLAATADRRKRVVALSEMGRDLTERAAEHIDQRCFEDIRPSSDGERNLYQRMADIVVRR